MEQYLIPEEIQPIVEELINHRNTRRLTEKLYQPKHATFFNMEELYGYYYAVGISLFPSDTKEDTIEYWQAKEEDEIYNEVQTRTEENACKKLAMICGERSGAIVIVVKDGIGQDKWKTLCKNPRTMTVRCRGETHYYFRYNNASMVGLSSGETIEGIEIRSNGSCVILPGSEDYSLDDDICIYHRIDGRYKPAEMPMWLINKLRPSNRRYMTDSKHYYSWFDFITEVQSRVFAHEMDVVLLLQKVFAIITDACQEIVIIKVMEDSRSRVSDRRLVTFGKTTWAKFKRNSKTFFSIASKDKKGNSTTTRMDVFKVIEYYKSYLQYSQIVFDPLQKHDETKFNIFSGWNAKIREDIPEQAYNRILWHVYAVLCSKDLDLYTWYLDELAYKFQHPTKKTGHSCTFVSKQGAGKNTFIEWVGYELFGGLYCKIINDIDVLLGEFNSVLEGTMWMILDECRGYGKQGEKMKNLITQTRTSINNKGLNRYEIDQYCTFTSLTNTSSYLQLENEDRRHVIIECSNEYIGDTEYFNLLHQQMATSDAIDGFYTMLMNRDLSYFNPYNHNFPRTQLHLDVIEQSKDSIEQFIDQIQWDDHEFKSVKGRIKNSDFFQMYLDYCNEQGLAAYSLQSFNKKKTKYVLVGKSTDRYVSKK